ncbi:hypothetical protein ABW21_db0203646 [Orbilia brochopaga]|nr:hypothetical protein ABW21_db0203646 [Drechslerella brochopaga]
MYYTFVVGIYLSMIVGPRPYDPSRRIGQIITQARGDLRYFAQRTQDFVQGTWRPKQDHCERCQKIDLEEARLELAMRTIRDDSSELENVPKYDLPKKR